MTYKLFNDLFPISELVQNSLHENVEKDGGHKLDIFIIKIF